MESVIKERASMDEKIRELRDTVKELLQNIIKRIDDITDEQNAGGEPDTDRLANLFDDLSSLAEGVSVIKEYYPAIDLMEFRDKLDMMENAMKTYDMMLLSDLLKYELRDLLGFWENILHDGD
jgi:predicted nuclease with TOPRIM domain